MRALWILLSAFFLVALVHPVLAAEKTAIGKLVVETVWARASAVRNGAAYVTIRNDGKTLHKLVGVSTPIAKSAGLHTVTMRDGVMRMHSLKAIEIHPGEPAVMQPGGNHIMLMGLKQSLSKGQRFPLTLYFEKAGRLTVTVQVMGPGARGMNHRMGHGKQKSTH